MVATYELGGGWLHIAPREIGKRAFLGNSGMAAPGRAVPNRGLVGVLSAAPQKAKKGGVLARHAADAAAPRADSRRPEPDVLRPPDRLRGGPGPGRGVPGWSR